MTHISKKLFDDFIELQKTLNPDVFIEIGAHEAEFSQTVAEKFPGSDVYAFEANPYVYIKNYPIKNVNYINNAISSSLGFVDFQIQNDNDISAGNNTILKRNEDKDYLYIKVLSTTVDSLFTEYKNVCMWVDCEGANKEVLLGSENTLKNVSSIFIEVEEIEFWKDQWLDTDVISYLESLGFIMLARDSQYNNQYNCIFVKEGY